MIFINKKRNKIYLCITLMGAHQRLLVYATKQDLSN